MPITEVAGQYDFNESGATASTTAVAVLPSAPTVGNLLVACVRDNSGLEPTNLDGFTKITWAAASNGSFGVGLYYRTVQSGDDATVIITLGASTIWMMDLLELTGQGAAPLDVSASGVSAGTTLAQTTGTTGATSASGYAVARWGSNAGMGEPFSVSNSFTRRTTASNRFEAAGRTGIASGVTVETTLTQGTARQMVGVIAVFEDAAISTPVGDSTEFVWDTLQTVGSSTEFVWSVSGEVVTGWDSMAQSTYDGLTTSEWGSLTYGTETAPVGGSTEFIWSTSEIAGGSTEFIWDVGDVTPPTVVFTEVHGDGHAVDIHEAAGFNAGTGILTIAGTASDTSGIDRIEVFVDDDEMVGATGTTSWSLEIDVSGWTAGAHVIEIIAYDSAGNSAATSRTVWYSPDRRYGWTASGHLAPLGVAVYEMV